MHVGEILEQKYLLTRFVSQGERGSSWLADELDTERSWFCKCLALPRGGWDGVHRLEQEADMLRQLRHPAIPRFRDLFVSEKHGTMCLLREWMPGQNLETLLEQRRFSEQDARAFAQQLLSLLVYLHGLSPQVLHLSLQPRHILLTTEGELSVVEVQGGPSSHAWAETSLATQGCFGYASPEQFLGRPGPASDLYALGATLIHLLSRRHPADLTSEEGSLQFQELINVSPSLLSWLETLVDPVPERRFATAQMALEALLRGQDPSGQEPSPQSPVLREGLRHQEYPWAWERSPEDTSGSLSPFHAALGSRFAPLFQHLKAAGHQHDLNQHMSLSEVIHWLEAHAERWDLSPAALLLKTLHPMDAADALFSSYEPSFLLHDYGPEIAERFSLLWTRTSHNAIGQWWLLYFLQKHRWNPLPYWRQLPTQQLAFRQLTHLSGRKLTQWERSFGRFRDHTLGQQAERFPQLQAWTEEARDVYQAFFSIHPDHLRAIVKEEKEAWGHLHLQRYDDEFRTVWGEGGLSELLQHQLGRLPGWLKSLRWWHKEDDNFERIGRLAGTLYTHWREMEKARTRLEEEYHWLLEAE